jgi:hypothetical protein
MKLIVCLLISVFASAAFAKDVTITVPDSGVSYDGLSENFDGSVAIIGPKVFANGQWLPILDAVFGKVQAAQMACLAFGFSADGAAGTPRPQGDAESHFAMLGVSAGKVYLLNVYEKASVQSTEVLDVLKCNKK